jgi:hypothetical protein
MYCVLVSREAHDDIDDDGMMVAMMVVRSMEQIEMLLVGAGSRRSTCCDKAPFCPPWHKYLYKREPVVVMVVVVVVVLVVR